MIVLHSRTGAEKSTTKWGRWPSAVAIGLIFAAAQVGVQTWAAAPAAASVDATVRRADSAFDSEPVKSATARCRAGERVLGGGGQLFGDNGRVVLATMIPLHNTSFDSYTVTAVERPGGHSLNWTLRAYAVCAAPLPGIEIVMAFTTHEVVKSVVAVCPVGKVVVGTGGAVGFPGLGTTVQKIWPHRLTSPARDGVRVMADEDHSSTAPPDYAVFAWAVCAYPPLGYQHVRNDVRTEGRGLISIARCPEGQFALATAMAWVNVLSDGKYTNSHLQDMFTDVGIAWARARLSGDPDTSASMSTIAICAD